jgi:hypothetical protein
VQKHVKLYHYQIFEENMQKDILVAILEDDLFSRNWMALLLVRDWRTRLMGEISNLSELILFLEKPVTKVHILLMDVDVIGNEPDFPGVIRSLKKYDHGVKILCTGVRTDDRVIKSIENDAFCGYILKHEIGYSLGWAISFAYEDHFIFTPSTYAQAIKLGIPLSATKMVLAGRAEMPGFSDRESEVARLAFIFSLGRRDLAEELKISDQWSYGMVSELYAKLGIGDILSGEVDPIHYLGDNPILLDRFKKIVDKIGPSRKAKDIEALAFHFLTMPEIL